MKTDSEQWLAARGLRARGAWSIVIDWYPKPTRIMMFISRDRWSLLVSHGRKSSHLVVSDDGIEAHEDRDDFGLALLRPMAKRWLLPIAAKDVKVDSKVRGAERAVRAWFAPTR